MMFNPVNLAVRSWEGSGNRVTAQVTILPSLPDNAQESSFETVKHSFYMCEALFLIA